MIINSQPLYISTLLLVMFVLHGCQGNPLTHNTSDAAISFENSLQQSREHKTRPEFEKLNPDFMDSLSGKDVGENGEIEDNNLTEFTSTAKASEHRYNITADQGEVRPLLMSLVRGTKDNMVVHPSITGKVSLSLKNVTTDEVMQALRDVYGYEFRRNANGYEVLPPELQSRIYFVNYLNVQRSGKSNIRVSSGQISESATVNEKDRTKTKDSSTSGSQISTSTESDFWQGITLALSAIIGEQDGRKVVVNAQSGVVIVRAMPKELRTVEQYLSATQSIIHRQVILEAKILEVELNENYQAGINWAAFLNGDNSSALIAQTGGGTVFNGNGLSDTAGESGDLDPSNPDNIGGALASAFGGVFSLALNLNNFKAFIEALKGQGDVHVLSSPRVSTVNNQKAVIKVGEDEFFVTDLSTDTLDSNGGINQTVDVELTPFFSGVALDVIPQIDNRGNITLYIHPSVSDVNEKVKEITVSTKESLKIPLALSTIRESDSIVRAKSGQVVVIGGLMQNISQDLTAGIPVLSSLPLVGAFFRHQKTVFRKTELVILLRPIVVDQDSVWTDNIAASYESARQIIGAPKNENE